MAGYFYIKFIEGIRVKSMRFLFIHLEHFKTGCFFLLEGHSSTASTRKRVSTVAVLIKPLPETPKDSLQRQHLQLYIPLLYASTFTLREATTKISNAIHL